MLLSPIELICKNTHTYVLVQWVHTHMQGPSHAVTAARDWDVQSQQRGGHAGARPSDLTLWCVSHATVPLGTENPSCSFPQQQPLEETELWGTQFKGRKMQLFGDTPHPTPCSSQSLGKSWADGQDEVKPWKYLSETIQKDTYRQKGPIS